MIKELKFEDLERAINESFTTDNYMLPNYVFKKKYKFHYYARPFLVKNEEYNLLPGLINIMQILKEPHLFLGYIPNLYAKKNLPCFQLFQETTKDEWLQILSLSTNDKLPIYGAPGIAARVIFSEDTDKFAIFSALDSLTIFAFNNFEPEQMKKAFSYTNHLLYKDLYEFVNYGKILTIGKGLTIHNEISEYELSLLKNYPNT